jgi:hypothetical protein
LELSDIDISAIHEHKWEQQISLTLVKTLKLQSTSSEAVAQIFTTLAFPRLTQLTALNANPVYPFQSITLPTSLEYIECRFGIFDQAAINQQIPHLKLSLFQPGSAVSLAANSWEFSCTMAPMISSSKKRLPWRLVVCGYRDNDLLHALKKLRATFEDELRSSEDGIWLLEIDGLILQMDAKLEKKQRPS